MLEKPVTPPQVVRTPTEPLDMRLLAAGVEKSEHLEVIEAAEAHAASMTTRKLFLLDQGAKDWPLGTETLQRFEGQRQESTKASHLKTWCEYRHALGKSPDNFTKADVVQYRTLRTRKNSKEPRSFLRASSWNAVNDTLMVHAKTCVDSPLSPMTTMPYVSRKSEAKLPQGTSLDKIRDISNASFRKWVQWGVLQQDLPPGVKKESLRTAQRDEAFALCLVTTFLRREEETLLTLFDLPRQVDFYNDFGEAEALLPSAIAKKRSGRRVYFDKAWFDLFLGYLSSEWRDVVTHRQSDYQRMTTDDQLTVVTAMNYRTREGAELYVEGDPSPRSMEDFSRRSRRALVMRQGVAQQVLMALFRDRPEFDVQEFTSGWELVPAVAFPSHLRGKGLPGLTAGRWNQVFAEISTRAQKARTAAVAALDEDAPERVALERLSLDVAPHDLRHLGAVNFLDMRYEEIDAKNQLRDRTRGSTPEKLQALALDPTNELRQRLGHKNLETTMIYLQLARQRRRTKTPGVPSLWEIAMGEGDA